jgi:aminoglycoside phosphotransferase (APT) family kinase protein
MGLNSTELSLSLALHSLETTVLPDATSDAARNAISNIRLTLTDLLKRQGPAVGLLKRCIDDGEALHRRIQQILGATVTEGQISTPDHPPSFDYLVAKHSALTERLNQVAMQLADASPTNPEAGAALRAAAEWEELYYLGLPKLQVTPFGDDASTPSTSKPPLTAEYLRYFLRTRRHDNSLQVTDFVPVPGGYGNQTFFCTVKSKGKEDEKIVVRKSDGVPIVLSLEQEYDLLRILGSNSVPVAKAGELATNLPGVDGTFYTMNRIPGRMIGSYVDGTKMKFSEKLLFGLAEVLGKLHSIPLENFKEYITVYKEDSVINENNQERHHRKLLYWQNYSQDVDHPSSPYVTWLFNWLKQNIPKDTRRPVLTHGDFNVHNVLADGDDLTGVLDWECSDFGAPEMDLAYLQPTVAAHMDWGTFLEHYYKHGGKQIDPASMIFCAVYSGLRLALAAGRFTLSLQNGTNRDIRFINVEQNLEAAIMAMGLSVTNMSMNSKAVQAKPAYEGSVKEPSLSAEVSHVELV